MTTEPRKIIAGDSLSWTRTLLGYSAADGWALSYRLVSVGVSYDIPTSGSGEAHQVNLDGDATKDWVPNEYQLVALVSNGPARHTIGSSRVTVKPNPASAGYDPRSHAEKVLAEIEKLLETKATRDTHTVTVEGQTVGRYDWDGLMAAEKRYRGRVNRERRAERAKRTGRHSNRVLVRMPT